MDKIKAQIKQAYKSWTVWFNAVGMLLLSSALADPMVLEYLTDNGFMLVILVGNVVLRFKTSKGLEEK